MSTARWGKKWADEEEDDDNLVASPTSKGRFETKADAQGIKTVITYSERDNKTWKITKKLKQTTISKWTNKAMLERKNMSKFGKALTDKDEASKIVRSEEEVPIELTKKTGVSLTTKDDVEDKFFEESLSITETLCKEKKVWTDINRERQQQRDGVEAEKAPDPTATGGDAPTLATGQAGRYVPPSLRGVQPAGKGGGKGGGGDALGAQQEASVRITNLSEDVRDGDLQDLFGQFGRLQRVYLAKDQTTGTSKGFAFVTYYTKEDAQKAIDKLNGHGYDNLILQVQWAKPRA